MSFFKSLCSGNKPDFADMIPDKLTQEYFEVHQVSRHGLGNLDSQSSCICLALASDLPSWSPEPAVLPGLRQRAGAAGRRLSQGSSGYVSLIARGATLLGFANMGCLQYSHLAH